MFLCTRSNCCLLFIIGKMALIDVLRHNKQFFFFLLLFFFALTCHQCAVVVDYCDISDPHGCGPKGRCTRWPGGARCQCPDGWMGIGCKRPCQDVQRSCGRWRGQGRCTWHKIISPFFFDNCALSCGFCRPNKGSRQQKSVVPALSPMLESMAWLIGRWQTRTTTGSNRTDRFPAPMSGPYIEILDVQIADAPAFDRPSLNVSVRAWSTTKTAEGEPQDEHRELGFLTVKPAREQTGFVESQEETDEADRKDLVALELVSNTGVLIIEEGSLIEPKHLEISTRWHKYFEPIHNEDSDDIIKQQHVDLDSAHRSFLLVEPNILEERLDYTMLPQAERRRVMKRYRKVHDYFNNV